MKKNPFSTLYFRLLTIIFSICLFAFSGNASAMNIDPLNQYAWGENIGWITFGSIEGDVDVTATSMDGYAWGENIGWISLTCNNTASCGTVDYGVTISGSTVSGYAWGENVGWISFNCLNTSSCGTVDYGVTVNTTTGDFAGYAWGENIGWIVFNCSTTASCGTVDYKLRTTAVLAPTPTPDDGPSGGGQIPTPTPTLSPTPILTPFPTVSPGITPTPRVTPRVSPRVTPSPFPTPTSTPPGGVPTSPPPVVGPGTPPVIRFTNWLNNLFDFLIEFFGLADRTVCIGPLGIAACGSMALPAMIVILALLAALIAGEWLAAGLLLLLFFGFRRKIPVWGTVYDSRTKHPVPFVKLQLLDTTGRVIQTQYSDRDGKYGFRLSSASEQTQPFNVQVRAAKPGYLFPSGMTTQGTDFIVYDSLYRGGMIEIIPGRTPHYNVPMDPTGDTRQLWSGLGYGRFGTRIDALLSFAFIIGLIVVPLNWWYMPTTSNLVILIAFLVFSAFRIFVLNRPYGLTFDSLTGKRSPYALVVLNDLHGNRKGFAVSDEQGRFILSGEQNTEYEIVAYTPAAVSTQRSVRMRVRSTRSLTHRSWITTHVRI